MDSISVPEPSDDETVKLLKEWYRWWWNSDDAPAKLPEGLHVRTATFLTVLRYASESTE